jgi:hypothetical protein
MDSRIHRLFRCPSCGWWAIGSTVSAAALSDEQLSTQKFSVSCVSGDCDWKGELEGLNGTGPYCRPLSAKPLAKKASSR